MCYVVLGGVTGGGTIANSGDLGTAGTTPITANLNSTGKLVIDLGSNNTDFFSVTGNATLSGLLDDVLEPGFTPSGSYTVLTTTGTLNTAGLALDPSDVGVFSLTVSGKNLVLAPAAGVAGDFNGNGVVDAADYVLWRNGGPLQNDPTPGVQPADYTFWRSRFGATFGSGSRSGAASGAVPEPATWAMAGLVICLGVSCVTRHRALAA